MNEDICKEPLVLFLGAGASKPLGLKTMPEFWEWFENNSGYGYGPQRLSLGFLSAIALSIEPSDEIGRKPDVEAVLDILEKVNEGRELGNKVSQTFDKSLFSSDTTYLEISEDIKDSVIRHYWGVDEEKAFKLYRPLLELAIHRPLPIFTTNYDPAIEKAYEFTANPSYELREAPYNLVDGFSRERIVTPIWSRSAYEHFTPTGADLILFKLHGSVNWVRTTEGIQRVDIPQRDLGGAPTVIAYPSRLKREIHDEPFRTNYDYLIYCLLNAKVCAVIGFSFRDQEIVEEFRQAMEVNKKLGLMIIDPNAEAVKSHLEAKLGFDPRAELITEEFSPANASSLADRIRAKIQC